MLCNDVHEIVIDDAFVRLGRFLPHADLILKLEDLNPAGSIKAKTAIGLIEDAERKGKLKPGSTVIESSSGSLGVALSGLCTSKKLKLIVVVDPNTSPLNKAHMQALGAEVVVVEQKDIAGGYLHSRINYIESRLRDDPTLFWPCQYENLANREAHRTRTAAAITAEFSLVDYLFVGTGTGGTLTGCALHFKEHSPRTKIIAVDSEGSVTFGRPAGQRFIPGIGASRRPELFSTENVADLVTIPEIDTIAMCRFVAREHGMLRGGSTGTVLAAVRRYGDAIEEGTTIVAISPNSGEKYLHTIYNDEWVREKFGECAEPLVGTRANPSKEVS